MDDIIRSSELLYNQTENIQKAESKGKPLNAVTKEVSFPFLSSIKVTERACEIYMCVVELVKKLWCHGKGGGWFPEEDK